MDETYNPSSWPQRIIIAAIAAFATCIAIYLSLYQWQAIPFVWDPVFGDGTKNVLTSPLSHQFTKWIRIPDASLGVFAYFSDIVFAMAGSKQRWIDRPWLVILFGICVIPVGCVSITLVVLQGLVVKSWCFLCLITATTSLVLIFLSYIEVIATLRYLHQLLKLTDWGTTWWALWGYPCEQTMEAANRVKEHVGKNR